MFFWRFQHSPIVKTLNLNVWTLPLIFLHDFTLFVIDMHQNRSVSLFSTPFDHFHFHALAALIWWVQLRSCHNQILHIPEAILACDDPQIASLSMHQSKVRQSFQILYFRRFLTRSARADNQKMYIKSMIKHYSWHKSRHWLTKQSWGSGISSAWWEVCC